MRSPLFLLALVLLARSAAAQSPAGRIEGEVYDSIRAKPMPDATVLLTRMEPAPSVYANAVTDAKGRFRFDSLTAGRYVIGFVSAFLDSIDLALPTRNVVLEADQRLRVDFAVPSGATLRAAACPGLSLPTGKGGVFGQVTDADSDTPLRGADVVVSWNELTVDRATLKASVQQRAGSIRSDSVGAYRLCGVPTGEFLTLQVQSQGRVGSAVRVLVPDDVGIVVKNLSLSATGSRSVAELDSASAREDGKPARALSGSATLAGVVTAASGSPLGDAQVRVVDAAAPSVRTDSTGAFTLAGLPAGTQMLEVRRVGYLLGQIPVELRAGRTTTSAVKLARIVSLDSIRVIAQRSRYRDFESNRKMSSGFGRFLTEEDIEKRHPLETSDLVRMMPGFRVVGFGIDTKVVSSRGSISLRNGPCETNVVIDGMQHQDINLLRPSDIGAIETYAGPSGAPLIYDSACGVIVIWTKR